MEDIEPVTKDAKLPQILTLVRTEFYQVYYLPKSSLLCSNSLFDL